MDDKQQSPSFCLAALTTFNFGAWSQWELDRAFMVRTIRRKMTFATTEEAKLLVDEWNARDAELRKLKPSFGAFPTSSKGSKD